MRHTVLIENADMPFSAGIRLAEQIRRENGTEFLTAIAEGDLRSDGRLTESPAGQRADRWLDAGADLVLRLPVFSTLGGYGKKDFATAALIQRLHSVDRVILPCRPVSGQTVKECETLLRRCAMLMFREHPDYRKRLQENLRTRTSFLRAQMEAVVFCIPEAGELLKFPENRQGVCMLDAMLQLYYLVQVEFRETAGDAVDVDDPKDKDASKDAEASEKRLPVFERNVAQGLKTILETKSRDFLMNISGSTEKAVDRILKLSGEIAEKDSFREIVKCVEDAFPNEDMARLFLLRVLLNIRHSDMLISGLHTYVPYCRLLRKREDSQEEFAQVEKLSWVPFVRTDGSRYAEEIICASQTDNCCTEPVCHGQIDETLQILLDIDRRMEKL